MASLGPTDSPRLRGGCGAQQGCVPVYPRATPLVCRRVDTHRCTQMRSKRHDRGDTRWPGSVTRVAGSGGCRDRCHSGCIHINVAHYAKLDAKDTYMYCSDIALLTHNTYAMAIFVRPRWVNSNSRPSTTRSRSRLQKNTLLGFIFRSSLHYSLLAREVPPP